MLARDDIVAVDVALHNNYHAPVTIAAIEAGKHVFAEKPVAVDPVGIRRVMAAGRLAILPPSFRGVLGEGPVYREPDQVAETVRFLQGEDRFHARYLEEQDSALRERFGPQRLLDLLAEFLRCAGDMRIPVDRPLGQIDSADVLEAGPIAEPAAHLHEGVVHLRVAVHVADCQPFNRQAA